MSDLYPTRTRRKLLLAVDNQRVAIVNGITVWQTDGSFNQRCDAKVRELAAAGWVRLGESDVYELTDDGRAVLDGGGS